MAYHYKQDFPIFQHTDVAYIDNAATAQRPQCVLDAVVDFYRCHNANPLRGLYPLSVEATDIYEQARETVRDFIGARSEREIIFTRNTTESLNLIAYSYGLTHVKAGDEVLVSIMEHHSDLLPWQMVCRQTGAELKFIECAPDGSVDLKQIESLITERTKIVAMTQVSNVLGRKYPVQEVAAMAHKKGAVMVVDGAQSTPHMPVNVQELGADFFAFSGHKVFGPMGIGGLYGREDLLEEMPPFLSGGEMIESVTRTGAVYAELPHKFEAGTVNAAGAAGLAAAIRYVQSVGFDTIQQRGGVQAKDDMVGLPDKILKIVGLTAGDIAVLQRVLQMSLAAVDAVHMEACAGQLQRVLAAQQTQTYYEITFCFIKHLLPPRQAALHLQKSRASSSGWLRRRPRSGAARRQQPAPQGS